jgi:hypothetical protein
VAGKPGRGGRPKLSIAAHKLSGTYRPDRHAPSTPGATALDLSVPDGTPSALLAGLGDAGRSFVVSTWQEFEAPTGVETQLLRLAAEALDDQATYRSMVSTQGALLTGSGTHLRQSIYQT